MEPELVNLIATTTGPVSTVLAVGFVWLRGQLARQTEALQDGQEERRDLDRRLRELELPGVRHPVLRPHGSNAGGGGGRMSWLSILGDVADAARELVGGVLRERREHPQEWLDELVRRHNRFRKRGRDGLARVARRRARRWAQRFDLESPI